jgi:hypothetical protein
LIARLVIIGCNVSDIDIFDGTRVILFIESGDFLKELGVTVPPGPIFVLPLIRRDSELSIF